MSNLQMILYGFPLPENQQCTSCKSCHPNATKYGSCPAGSTKDDINCTCNAGLYGNGTFCTPCKACDLNALTVGSCPAGSSKDSINCICRAGYYGSGATCTICGNGSFSNQGMLQFAREIGSGADNMFANDHFCCFMS
jgi:hypothetical protein